LPRIVSKKLRLDRKGRISIRLACGRQAPAGCKGKITLRTRHQVAARGKAHKRLLTLATARFSIGAGKKAAVTLRLTAAKARLVRAGPAARQVLAIVQAGGPAGGHATTRRTLTVRPR
jgi:hypothetical protein